MIKWKAEATCDCICDAGGGCEEKTKITLSLDKQRAIDIETPPGWAVQYRGDYGSGSDVNDVNLSGDDVRVYCPKHKDGRCYAHKS